MKKVGIITYHFAKNYGAVLQCYALQTYLSQKGYEVTVFVLSVKSSERTMML